MAVGVLDLGRQLREGAAEGRQEHHRIEAESVGADRLARDLAGGPADGHQGFRIVGAAQCDQGAHQRGAAVVDAGHLLEQCPDVVGIALRIAEARRVVGGVDAGQAAEGIDAQSGVVGDGRQAGGGRGMARLRQRVLDEGAEGLGGLAHAQVGLPHQLEAQWRQERLQLGELAGIVGGEDELHGGIRVPFRPPAPDAAVRRVRRCPWPPGRAARPSRRA